MGYRKFSADRVFDGFSFLPAQTIVITDSEGMIQDLVTKEEAGEGIEDYDGILSPAFINSHCHLELSHMKGIIPAGTGLIDFLIGVVANRGKEDEAFILDKIAGAEQEMYENGIAAVGDISNTLHSFHTKSNSRLQWHTLVEVLNFFDTSLPHRLGHNQSILEEFKTLPPSSILTPHAPYTVSAATYQAINEATEDGVISIHNQETQAEDELFKEGKGEFLRLYETLGIGASPFAVSGKTSLQTYLPYFTKGQTIVLVHNTFTREEDILFAKAYAEKQGLNIVYCLCPNANLYIENSLPPVDLFIKHGCTLLLGTDSYSSNWQLSIAKEIEALQKNFPHIPLQEMLQWATSNGAAVFGWKDLGRLQKGSRPGLALFETDLENKDQITGYSKRII